MKLLVKCDFCGNEFYRESCRLKCKFHFCSRDCLAKFSNKATNPDRYLELKDYSIQGDILKRLNPITNKTRMTPSVKEKIRRARLKEECKSTTYKKTYGMHTHRVVAESLIGRKLLSNEIVHHIDGNKHNNEPSNLQIMDRKEHASYHSRLWHFFMNFNESEGQNNEI